MIRSATRASARAARVVQCAVPTSATFATGSPAPPHVRCFAADTCAADFDRPTAGAGGAPIWTKDTFTPQDMVAFNSALEQVGAQVSSTEADAFLEDLVAGDGLSDMPKFVDAVVAASPAGLLSLIRMREHLISKIRQAKKDHPESAGPTLLGKADHATPMVALENTIQQKLRELLTNTKSSSGDTQYNNVFNAEGVNVSLSRVSYEDSPTPLLQKVYWYERVMPYADHEEFRMRMAAGKSRMCLALVSHTTYRKSNEKLIILL